MILYEELDRQLQDLQEKLTEVRTPLTLPQRGQDSSPEESGPAGLLDDPAAAEVMQELTRHPGRTFRQLKGAGGAGGLAQLGEEEGIRKPGRGGQRLEGLRPGGKMSGRPPP